MASTLTKLNDNDFQASWKASELAHEQLSAKQANELAEIKRLLEANSALIKAATFETKESGSSLRFGVSIDLESLSVSNTDSFL